MTLKFFNVGAVDLANFRQNDGQIAIMGLVSLGVAGGLFRYRMY